MTAATTATAPAPRQHLTTAQRAAIGAELLPRLAEEAKKRQATAEPGLRGGRSLMVTLPQAIKGPSRDLAAKAVQVSASSIQRAHYVKQADPRPVHWPPLRFTLIGPVRRAVRTRQPTATGRPSLRPPPEPISNVTEYWSGTITRLDKLGLFAASTPHYGTQRFLGYWPSIEMAQRAIREFELRRENSHEQITKPSQSSRRPRA